MSVIITNFQQKQYFFIKNLYENIILPQYYNVLSYYQNFLNYIDMLSLEEKNFVMQTAFIVLFFLFFVSVMVCINSNIKNMRLNYNSKFETMLFDLDIERELYDNLKKELEEYNLKLDVIMSSNNLNKTPKKCFTNNTKKPIVNYVNEQYYRSPDKTMNFIPKWKDMCKETYYENDYNGKLHSRNLRVIAQNAIDGISIDSVNYNMAHNRYVDIKLQQITQRIISKLYSGNKDSEDESKEEITMFMSKLIMAILSPSKDQSDIIGEYMNGYTEAIKNVVTPEQFVKLNPRKVFGMMIVKTLTDEKED